MKKTTVSALAIFGLFVSSARAADDQDSQVEMLQPGVQLSLMAEHPALVTPTGIDVDHEGRIWVVATHTHFRPDGYVGPKHDEILIFTDKDRDGRAEQRQVFYNATDATMDLELGSDGWVYLAWSRACRREVQNRNPCVIYGTFVAKEPKHNMNRDGWVYF